ncbi:MAG: MOSC domain-containing protein [Acidobacteriota bacterium]
MTDTSAVGRLVGIVLGPEAKAPLDVVDEATAVADRGLDGDRYFYRRGSFNRSLFDQGISATGRQITLIDAAAIATCNERLAETLGDRCLSAADLRRNLVTEGVDLPSLVRRRFRVGEALLVGVRLCPPCKVLRRIVGGVDVLAGLKGIGGLRADVVGGGTIRVGDSIRVVD